MLKVVHIILSNIYINISTYENYIELLKKF